MRRTFTLSVLLMLGLVMPITDVMAQSSAGRGCGRRYHWRCSWRAARRGNRSRHWSRCGSPSQQAWPLLLASWSLLGAHRWKIASRIFSLLQVGQGSRKRGGSFGTMAKQRRSLVRWQS